MSSWTVDRYAIFRAILGLYLGVHFAQLIPYAAELFSESGLLSASKSPLIGLFPNVLSANAPAWLAVGLTIAGMGLSALLVAGRWDRLAAFGIWLIWATLFGRNPMIANPSIAYIGWLLLMHTLVPRNAGRVEFPPAFWGLTWALLAVGYTFSGLSKLDSPSWLDGTAIMHVLESPLARPTIVREWLLSSPQLLTLITYSTLALEILVAPLALFRRTRPFVWLALVAMHLGILATVDFADLTLGMLVVHVITFDPNWIRDLRRALRWSGANAVGRSLKDSEELRKCPTVDTRECQPSIRPSDFETPAATDRMHPIEL